MVIDLDSRRPTRIPEAILARRFSDRPHALEPTRDRLRAFDSTDAEQELSMYSYTYHLDMNKHVNNTHYVDWMLEILTPTERHYLRWFDLVFLNELGAQVPIKVQRKANQLQLMNTDSSVIALACWS